MNRALGTLASPTYPTLGALLGAVNTHGWNEATAAWNAATNIRMYANQNWTSTAHGSNIQFWGVPDGSVNLAIWVKMTSGGILPGADSAYTLGDATPLYWSNLFTDRVTLNSTAYLDGGNAGRIGVTGTIDSYTITGGGAITLNGIAGPTYGRLISDTTYGLQVLTGATQKIAFFGGTPVVRAAAYTQTYSTANRTVANITYAAPSGGATVDTQCRASLAQLAADCVNLRQLISSLIDDEQGYGLAT